MSMIESVFNWSAKMCERIDADNFSHLQSPMFARRIEDLPPLPNPCGIFNIVKLCFESSVNRFESQHKRFEKSTTAQMIACGFSVDYIDEDGHVNYSRWIDANQLQICRIEFL